MINVLFVSCSRYILLYCTVCTAEQPYGLPAFTACPVYNVQFAPQTRTHFVCVITCAPKCVRHVKRGLAATTTVGMVPPVSLSLANSVFIYVINVKVSI